MQRITVRSLGIAGVALFLCMTQAGRGGTIRHDREDLLYTDLAALPDFQSVGLLRSNAEIDHYSGTLIAPQWVLVAAHTVTFPTPTTGTFEVGGVVYQADQWIAHPSWAGVLGRGVDLSLVHLTTPVVGVTPATIYTGTNEFGKAATIVGFGLTGNGFTGSQVDTGGTKRAGENIIDVLGSAIGASDNYSLTDFDSPFANLNSFGDEFPLDLEYKTALGDSGGGVFIEDAGKKVLAGIPSFSAYADDIPNSSYGEIDGFTRVSLFRNWITETITPIPTWNVDADGNWSTAANWSSTTPSGAGAKAILGAVITAPRTVTLDTPTTVGRLDFDNTNSYTVAGTNALSLDATSGDAAINVVSGSHIISAPITLVDNTRVTVTPAAATLSLGGGVNAAGLTLIKAGAGTLAVSQLRAGQLSITSGKVMLTPSATSSASVMSSLSIAGPAGAPSAVFDVNNGAAVIDYGGTSPAATVRQRIIAGRGLVGLGATWNGMGITSSAAATVNATEPESRSVGYAENSTMPLGALTTFHGQAVDGTSVLIAFTRTGDANLDGIVNDDDVTIVGASYAPGVAGASWALGDFDYNGFVDDDDVTLLGAFYDPAAAPLNAGAPPSASAVTAVPEPGSVWLALIAAAFTATASSISACRRRSLLRHALASGSLFNISRKHAALRRLWHDA